MISVLYLQEALQRCKRVHGLEEILLPTTSILSSSEETAPIVVPMMVSFGTSEATTSLLRVASYGNLLSSASSLCIRFGLLAMS